MSKEIFDELKTFVTKESAVDDEEITRDTKIENDLGVTGEDAIDFMIAYGKAFNVDVTNFMAADYFKGDGIDIIGIEKTKKALTVGHLEKGILAGRLDEKVINS